jgi:hypothetical protein
MLSKLKSLWGKLAAPGGERASEAPAAEPVEYKGYSITPAPYKAGSQYQTAGIIRKETAEGLKEHRFVRADTHASLDDAIAFAVSKAKQIIDSQDEAMFR